MKLAKIRTVVLQAKYGSGLLLLLFDVILILFLLSDVAATDRLDLNYFAVMSTHDVTESFGFASFINFIIIFALPLTVALAGNFCAYKLAPDFYFKYTATGRARSWILAVHMLVAIGCVVHINSLPDIRRASGMCGPLGETTYCFSSAVFSLLENSQLSLLLTTVLLPIIGMVIKDGLYRGKELAKDFDFWRLIGAVGEYQPAYGEEIIYVNSASMAPSIRSINAATTAYHHKYQRAVPTSDRAKSFLTEKAERARQLLYPYLLSTNERLKKEFKVEFFPGTSRALEAGILRIGGIEHIILSQYEHPSQVDVVRWLCKTQGTITYKALLPRSSTFFQGDWERQKAEVCESIEAELSARSGSRIAVVLSEVHFLTGIHVQVGEVIEALRGERRNVVFIIDGSQAVGNLAKPFGDIAPQFMLDDFYYFSAHKWLLSPNTCGVLISYVNTPQRKGAQPYDMFGFELPTSTIDPNTVFGLTAALEFLFDNRRLFERFAQVSRSSKEYFRAAIEKKGRLEVVESATSDLNASLFLAVKPRLGYRWKYKKDAFWEHMRRRGVDLTLVPETKPYFESEEEDGPDVANYLLRISFPYFLLGRNVRKLVSHLNDLLVKAN